MIVYFSTIFRTAPLDQGGELVKVDWERKTVLGRVPIVPANPMITDPNPRGGTRGGRGVLLDGNEIYVASYHTINVFDTELKPVRSFSNQLFADLHEMTRDGQAVWASSTVLDAAVKVDRNGNTLDSWWPREDPVIARRFHLPPLPLNKEKDNRLAYLGKSHVQPGHTHLNTVTMLDGRPLVLLNHLGCLVRLHPTEIFVHDPRLVGAHNILVTPDRQVLVNDTRGQAVLAFATTGRFLHRLDLGQFWLVKKIRWRFAFRGVRLWLGKRCPSFKLQWLLVGGIIASRPVFVRGLCRAPHGTVLVGISPATILEVDWASGKLVSSFSYSSDVNVAVHGLACAAAQ